jgi:hypothetical protein
MVTMDAHIPIVRSNTALYSHLDEWISRSLQILVDNDFLEPIYNGPKVEEIESIADDYDHEIHDEKLPKTIDTLRTRALGTGAALEALGDLDSAILWYRIGQYRWREGADSHSDNKPILPWPNRESPAIWQENVGLCCALTGNNPHATRLFTWAAQNRSMTDEEIEEAENARFYQDIWQDLGFQIFSLTWLGDWPEILRLSKIGMRVVEKTQRAGYPKDFRGPQLLIKIGHTIATYYTSPNAASKEAAKNSITLKKVPDRDPLTRFSMLPYFFALIRKYPQLDPYPKLSSRSKGRLKIIADSDIAPLTEADFQRVLDDIFNDARRKGHYYSRVVSIGLHRRAGGYPGKSHQMPLCLDVMQKNMGPHDRILRQYDGDVLEIQYHIPRSD